MTEAGLLAWAVARADGPIVQKARRLPETEGLPAKEHLKPPNMQSIRFHFDAVAEPVSQQGKTALIGTPMPGWSPFEFYCNEGGPIGGVDDAPSPLGYLTAGVAFCLLTHITMLLGPTGLNVQRIKVEVRGNYFGETNPPCGGADGFETCIIIDSPEPAEKIKAFAESCQNACIALQTIANPTPVRSTIVHNGVEV